MTAPIADRAAGVLQGAVDATVGVQHKSRSGDRDHELGDREAAVHARREYLDRVAKEATAVEAAREAAAAEAEAGS